MFRRLSVSRDYDYFRVLSKLDISSAFQSDRFYSEMRVFLLDLPENFVRKLALSARGPFGTVLPPAVPYR